jgi:hypothetical protein
MRNRLGKAIPAAVNSELSSGVATSAEALFRNEERQLWIQTDKRFFWLFLVQWIGGIVICCSVSPVAWQGTRMTIHEHLFAAVGLGGLIVSLPMILIRLMPGASLTRQVVAVAQMSFGALLIHLTGGRIETHFHVFGSLAFLAFYRDPRVLITATVAVGLDHWLRSFFWPASVFGVNTGSFGRVLEHVGWVVFEDIFLFFSISLGRREMFRLAAEEHNRLSKLETELASAQKDTALILETVRQGLFLVAPDLRIRGDYSRALEGMLHRSDLAGTHFLDLMRPLVSEQLHGLTGDYLRLMFDKTKKESLLVRFNPLTRAEITFPASDREATRRFFEFGFKRVQNEGDIGHVLVSINDVTESVGLQNKLFDAERREKRHLQLSLEVLQAAPHVLAPFVAASQNALQRVNLALCSSGTAQGNQDREDKLRRILSIASDEIHAITRNAEAIRLTFFTEKALALEHQIEELQNRAQIRGEDFLAITIFQAEMMTDLDSVTRLLCGLGETLIADGSSQSLTQTPSRKSRRAA